MKSIKLFFMGLFLATTPLMLAACDDDTALENAAEDFEDGAEDIADSIDDAAN